MYIKIILFLQDAGKYNKGTYEKKYLTVISDKLHISCLLMIRQCSKSWGAPITEAFAEEIGADGYSDDAANVASLVKKLAA